MDAIVFVLTLFKIHISHSTLINGFSCNDIDDVRIEAFLNANGQHYLFAESKKKADCWLFKTGDIKNYPKTRSAWTSEDFIGLEAINRSTLCPQSAYQRAKELFDFTFGNLEVRSRYDGSRFKRTETREIQLKDGHLLYVRSTTVIKHMSSPTRERVVKLVFVGRSRYQPDYRLETYVKVRTLDHLMYKNSDNNYTKKVNLLGDLRDITEEIALYNIHNVSLPTLGFEFWDSISVPIKYLAEDMTFKEIPLLFRNGSVNVMYFKVYEGEHYAFFRIFKYIIPVETWLGCPVDRFCLGILIDAVVQKPDQTMIVIVGYYFFEIENMRKPLVESKVLLKDWLNDQNAAAPSSIDAAFVQQNMIYLIKDNVMYQYEMVGKSIVSVGKSVNKEQKFHSVGDKIEALVCVNVENERDYVYVFQGWHVANNWENHKILFLGTVNVGNVWKYECKVGTAKCKLREEKRNTEVNEAFPSLIDTVFYLDDKVYTIVRHFITYQDAATFFKQRVVTNFVILPISGFFGCEQSKISQLLSPSKLREYSKAVAPGVNISTDEPEDDNPNGNSGEFDYYIQRKAGGGAVCINASVKLYFITLTVVFLKINKIR